VVTRGAHTSEIDATGKRVALVVAEFNEQITSELAAGAREALLAAGVVEPDIEEHHVAGAFELAPACRQVVGLRPDIDAVVALGAVIRGETPHFDIIAEAAAQGLQRLAVELNIPLGFGVLTTDTREQAEQRASRQGGDKGGEAARAVLSQLALYTRLAETEPAVRGFRAR
jgi:6,7-dimethyl-8-ribityllumazine synthase